MSPIKKVEKEGRQLEEEEEIDFNTEEKIKQLKIFLNSYHNWKKT